MDKQTDHSFLKAKLFLRMNHLPDREPIRVLDAFSGNGVLWDTIRKETGRQIETLRIDVKKNVPGGGFT